MSTSGIDLSSVVGSSGGTRKSILVVNAHYPTDESPREEQWCEQQISVKDRCIVLPVSVYLS